MRILGIAGSIRRPSYNSASLEVVRLRENASIEILELDRMPRYNQDLQFTSRGCS
jgi:NAD(P)H-dependent FMN reductase